MASVEELFAAALAAHRVGRLEAAVAGYERVLAMVPEHPGTLNHLGAALYALGRREEAAACWARALRVRPDDVDAHNNLGVVLRDLGRLGEAAASHARAIGLRPGFAEAHDNLGLVLRALGRPEEAAASHARAIALRPDLATAHANLGDALRDLDRSEEAVARYEQALALRPDYAIGHNNLGVALEDLGRLDEAVASYERALALSPDYAEAYSNLGNALLRLGRSEDAATSCERALALRPELAAAHLNLAFARLHAGRLREGWRELEHRRRVEALHDKLGLLDLDVPVWKGAAFAGRTLLVQCEQGLGDALQFVRYVPRVKALGGTVVVRCDASLVRLLAGCAGADRVIGKDAGLPADLVVDAQVPLLDLPGIFDTVLDTIPADVPYLAPDAALVARWRQRLGAGGVAVGLAWAGNPRHRHDRERSIPFAALAPLASVAGVRLVSLQKGEAAREARGTGTPLALDDAAADIEDFADTAAVMASLDLVITVDTAVAHLAGALGREVWTLLASVPDWRWLLDREDSPWYPTMRLFRQRVRGEWADPVERVTAALTARVAHGG